MALFSLLGLLLSVLFIVTSDCSDGLPAIVSASPSEDVVLPCFNSPPMDPNSCYRVRWIKYGAAASDMKVILAWPKSSKIKDAERVLWKDDENQQMSLYLKNPQKPDEGLYSCEVWRGWDVVHVKNISLKVKPCKVLKPVQAAPSSSVHLNCPVDKHQNISWEMLKGDTSVSIRPERAEVNGTWLVIQTVDYSDEGWYRCKHKLGESERCFDIKLVVGEVKNAVVTTTTTVTTALTTSEVISETRHERRTVVIAGAVSAAAALTAALIGLFIYCRCNRSKSKPLARVHPPDPLTEHMDAYEFYLPASSSDSTNQRVNSLYQQSYGDVTCTFHY